MASNDYYNSYSTSAPRREDAPLPAVPSSTSKPLPSSHADGQSMASISPINTRIQSPFDDRAYPSYAPSSLHDSETEYHGAAGKYNNSRAPPSYSSNPHSDPFADQNAIPLQSQNPKMDSPTARYGADPEARMPLNGDKAYPPEPRGSGLKSRKKDGWFTGKITWMVYLLTTIQIAVFIAELARNGILTGTPIEIKPNFNPMIGPSPYVLINMGARFVPCMRNTANITDSAIALTFPCPNSTSLTDQSCTLSDLCGFSGVPNPVAHGDINSKPEPNQWWRFIIPIFMHAGIIHIGFNMLLQLTLGRDIEKEIGTLRFFVVYFASGIFGFVLGGNYAAPGIASTGASGALFGLLALNLLDLLYCWSERRSPWKELAFIILDIAIAFVLGLLPGLDNFSHIGGFLMGLVLGICILRSPHALSDPQRASVYEPMRGQSQSQWNMSGAGVATDAAAAAGRAGPADGLRKFAKSPLGFFKGRKPLWWAWWLFRAAALAAVLITFIVLLNNFYKYRVACGWCRHLSCLPVSNWCDIGNIYSQPTPSNSTKRDLFSPNAAGDLSRFLY